SPCSCCKSAHASKPVLPVPLCKSVSISKTKNPLFLPVAIPILRNGLSVHHLVIISVSVVASFTPLIVAGCFPLFSQFKLLHVHFSCIIECNGETLQPNKRAYPNAILRLVFSSKDMDTLISVSFLMLIFNTLLNHFINPLI